MIPRENSTTEPKHLVGVPKTCPRSNCPNPTLAIVWKGSSKQLQYHCYGCWRKFDYGGKVRSWAKQVSPPAWWLRRHAPDVEEAPKLLELHPPRRSRTGPSDNGHDTAKEPSRKRSHRRPSGRSAAKSSGMEDDTTNAVDAAEPSRAEPSQKRTRREKGTTAIATRGEDHGTGIAGSLTLPVIEVVPKSNGFGGEGAHHGHRTMTITFRRYLVPSKTFYYGLQG